MNNTKCDLCNVALDRYTRGSLRGLCGHCSKQLESGKASARIIVSESKAMAQRAQERRVR